MNELLGIIAIASVTPNLSLWKIPKEGIPGQGRGETTITCPWGNAADQLCDLGQMI